MKNVVALAAGFVFAIGLALGGMTQPEKIIGFLDFTGQWDPSLLLVMFGAIAAYAPFHRLVVRRGTPIFERRLQIPTRRDIDPRLVAGSAIFGAGWGLAGYCPGPGIVSIGAGTTSALVFVLAMISGMAIFRAVETAREARAEASAIRVRVS